MAVRSDFGSLYDAYCRNHTIVEAELIWDAVINQAASVLEQSETVYSIRERVIDRAWSDSITLSTSGTTGSVKQYRLGPLGSFWLDRVERSIKNCYGKYHVWISRIVGFRRHRPVLSEPYWIYDERVFGNSLRSDELIPLLDRMPHPIVISSTPSFYLCMLKDEAFCSWVKERGCELASTVTSGFFPSNLPVNDNMIDWVSGHNFFQCPHGSKHVLPIFAGSSTTYNILNLSGPATPPSDLLRVSYLGEKCPCGMEKALYYHVPHTAYSIRTGAESLDGKELACRLNERYESFQLIQREDLNIDILYIKLDYSDIGDDRTIVEDFLDSNGLDVGQFYRNKYLRTSVNADKTEAVYRNLRNLPYFNALTNRIFI